MKKEQLKSLILTALILNSIFLTTQIWFDKKLWPNGYNFFNSMKDIPIVGLLVKNFNSNQSLDTASFEDMTLPYRMIVSGSNNTRAVYLQNSLEYVEIKKTVLNVMDVLYASEVPKYTVIPSSEWLLSLKGSSILMDYGATMKMNLMAQARNKVGLALDSLIDGFSEIIIGPNDTDQSTVFVYIRDNKSKSYYRFTVAYNKQDVRNIIDAYAGQKQQKYAFAFELNLNKTEKNIAAPVDRMYLDPLVLLPIDKVESQPILHMENPFTKDMNPAVYEQVVQAFGLQPNNLRRSISSDGTVSYIENKATIDISPNGRIDYKAVDQKSGILAETLYEKINLIWEIASKQWNIAVPNQPFHARINSDLTQSLTKNDQENTIITLNYLNEGIPIIVDAATSGYSSGITAEFMENRLVRFSMLVRLVHKLDEYSNTAFVLEALDKIYSQVQKDQEIKSVFTCYVMNEQEQASNSSITWAVTQSGNTFIAK